MWRKTTERCTLNRGISIKKYNIIFFVLGTLSFISAIICAFFAFTRFNKVEHITNEYATTQSQINSLKEASDYLTDRARQYVITENPSFAQDYFHEVNSVQRREAAVEKIRYAMIENDIDTLVLMESALADSNHLMESEVYAMALVASTTDMKDLPVELFSYSLSDSDRGLSADEKTDKALEVLLGKDYSLEKASIQEGVAGATKRLLEVMEKYKDRCTTAYLRSFNALIIYLIITCLVFFLNAVFTVHYVLKPISSSVNALEEENPIPYSQSKELNYLAKIYNLIYEENNKTKQKLKKEAEHDALTGLLNRGGFETLKKFYKESNESLALIILDIDNFKNINDGYGHEAGDEAIKKVANILDESFRNNDFTIRYGGDEFVVIMTGIGKLQTSVIHNKLESINGILKSTSDDGLPPITLSAGVAVSEHGFGDELMKQADEALYKTKNNGKDGITFY